MSNINDKAVATEDTNAKNITEELDMSKVISGMAGETVEVELTKKQLAEQKANEKVEQKFGVEALAKRILLQGLVKETNESENMFFINRQALAYLLLEIKAKYPEHFWDIVDTSVMSKKTLERAMELVLHKSVDFPKAMDTKCGIQDIQNNVKLLKVDTRIQAFKTVEDIEKIYDLSFNKINNAKHLSDIAWEAMCRGEDKLYKEHMEVENAHGQAIKEDKLRDTVPDTMDIKTYLGYCRDNAASIVAIDEKNKKISYLEKELEFFKNLVANNGLLPKQDSEELSDITTEKNLYSKSLNEEK